MNLGSNFNKKKRKGEVQNKTKWKNSFGGKRLAGGKNQEERREKKSGQKIGEKYFCWVGGIIELQIEKEKKRRSFLIGSLENINLGKKGEQKSGKRGKKRQKTHLFRLQTEQNFTGPVKLFSMGGGND